MKFLAILILALTCGSVQAATHYIRDGGTASTSGTGSCTGWATANACDVLPDTMVRGDVYCFADGTYLMPFLTTANSGTQTITLRKAVHGDGGCANGADWVSTYGDGQANLASSIELGSDYWIIDGVTRNENNWVDFGSYGFRLSSVSGNTGFPVEGVCASNITVKYADIGGPHIGRTDDASVENSFKISGFAELCTNWTIARNYAHNDNGAFSMNGGDTVLIEYNYVAYGYGKEALRGQIAMKNLTMRYNIFKDACIGAGVEPCTALIGMFDGFENSAGWINAKIYGNVFFSTATDTHQDGVITVGGTNDVVTGVEIYNNTFAGFAGGQSRVVLIRGNDDVCRNNLGWDIPSGMVYSCSTISNNVDPGSDPFVDYAGENFHLSGATTAGFTLSAPYNEDMDGNTRGGDGTWDIGAFEYGGASPPSAPQNFRLISWLGTLLGLGALLGALHAYRNRWSGGSPVSARNSTSRPTAYGVGVTQTVSVVEG